MIFKKSANIISLFKDFQTGKQKEEKKKESEREKKDKKEDLN